MSDQPPPYDESTDGLMIDLQNARIRDSKSSTEYSESANAYISSANNNINTSSDTMHLTEAQVAQTVKELGSSDVWRHYADLCLSKHLDGRTMYEATIEDLVEIGFEKVHARAVIHAFQPAARLSADLPETSRTSVTTLVSSPVLPVSDAVAATSNVSDYNRSNAITTATSTSTTAFSAITDTSAHISPNTTSKTTYEAASTTTSSSASADQSAVDEEAHDSVPAVVFHTAVDDAPEAVVPQVAETKEDFPFSQAIHIYSPPRTEVQNEHARRLKEDISKTEVYLSDPFAPLFCSDEVIHRFLRARQYDYAKAYSLLLETIQWRASYRPQDILGSQLPNTGKTGKVFSHPIRDKWGRPILVLNNTKENCKDWDENIRWLTFQLERGRKAMEIDHARTGRVLVEKWIVFIHLTEFSLWNNPPWKVTSETLKLFTSRYPEFLGHAVLFEAPSMFSGLFSLCTPFLDEVTKNKVVWIKGECGEGQANDLQMKSLIGPDWKKITGAFQPVVTRNASPGFDFDKFWQGLLQEEKQWWSLHRDYAAKMKFTFPIESDESVSLGAEQKTGNQ